jgi:hypothetical protein
VARVQRRRAKFVPGDTAAKVHQTKEPEQKNDFDEWLARIFDSPDLIWDRGRGTFRDAAEAREVKREFLG